jgi:tRNA(Arg) A34 adenosine deaminase TadA
MARKRRRRPVLVVARAYNKRGHLIARAANSYTRTHPIQAKYAQMAGKPDSIFVHAEVACLLRAGDTPVHKLVVERYHKATGQPLNAKPCPICQLAIADWGVEIVEHTS